MLVTVSGVPGVMLVAVVTSPVLAVKVPFGTKLNSTLIGIACALLIAATASAAAIAPVVMLLRSTGRLLALPTRSLLT